MVNVVTIAAGLGGSVAQADWLGPKVGGRPALVLWLSDELGELLQYQCHDDSTINIVIHNYYYYFIRDILLHVLWWCRVDLSGCFCQQFVSVLQTTATAPLMNSAVMCGSCWTVFPRLHRLH